MPPDKFFVLSRGGPFGVGTFKAIPWHKQEKEHILNVLDIRVEYGEELDYGSNRGGYTTVGDHEHIQLIADYIQGHSMQEIGTIRGRSPATVNKQVREHNDRVLKMGYCPRCKRAGGKYFDVSAARGTAVKK